MEGKDYKYELIDMQEWQVLAAWYASVGQGAGWSRPWDFSTSTPSTKTLPGVTAVDSHVVGINLSNNHMAGTFPFALLTLPYLSSLNLSNNSLIGDIGLMANANTRGCARAQRGIYKNCWDFTKGLSAETIANLNADTEKWAENGTDADGNVNNWKNIGKPATDSYLTANGEVIEELRDLLFDIHSNKDNSIHVATTRLRLTRKNTIITFPKLVNGQKITISGRSSNPTATNRGIAPVQDHIKFLASESSAQYNGACIFLGNQVDGSEGTYTFVWKVETDETEPVDIQFQLTPDAGIDFTLFKIDDGDAVVNLDSIGVKYLNIAHNQFSGNIGLFANCFANLKALNASNNCFEDVYPMIPATVTTLDLSHQNISRVVPLHLANLSVADIATKVPSILLYDHANQTFTPNINLMCTTADNSWGMMMAYQNGQLAVPYVSSQNTYYGETGDTLNVCVYNNNGTPEGSTFRISFSFDEGDGNFDGQVNVLDLQTNILYIMEKYLIRPYNFTAANLWRDDLINVQDIISLVNQLMAAEQGEATNARRNAPNAELLGDVSVYVQDGKLMFNSIYPVAAFDLLLNGANSLSVTNDLERMGITFVTKKQTNGLHVIAYSMNGACIPSGTTAIGIIDSNAATVSHVMLSDSEANAITVSFSGTTTGIESIVSSPENDGQAIYDLQGRKVNATSRKGLYIKNGHKMIK